MDAENVLKSEIFRPIVITLVPGMVSLAPFFFVARYYHPDLLSDIQSHQVMALPFLFALVVAAGFIVEDIGSRIEVAFWSCVKVQGDDEKWYEYLKSKTIRECVADGYIRDVVLRMKFENSFSVALALFGIGYTWLFKLGVVVEAKTFIIGLVMILAFVAFLLFESRAGVKLLRDVRNKIC